MLKKVERFLGIILFSWAFCLVGIEKFPIASIYDLIKTDTTITLEGCHDAISFNFTPFPLSVYPDRQLPTGVLQKDFVARIPQGRVCSKLGFVLTSQNTLIKELLPQTFPMERHIKNLEETAFVGLQKISGRVAVITRNNTDCYFHWLQDILGRLAILQIQNVEYDWLYVPIHKPFMKETLELFGVDMSKVIQPNEFHYIQADELIVPSLLVFPEQTEEQARKAYPTMAAYCPPWYIDFIRNKFLPLAQALHSDTLFSKKIFISRKDAGVRRMINEDEVFALFEPLGFYRYELGKLTVLEQIALFNQAEVVVAAHGSGLINLMFCNKDVHVYEIFQGRGDCTFYYLALMCGLRHTSVSTMAFDSGRGFFDTVVPLQALDGMIKELSR